jgi:hypothetical protein
VAPVAATASAAPDKTKPKKAEAKPKDNAIVAQVPLFGLTPMATMEPVPPPPPGGQQSATSEEEAKEMAAAQAAANESWASEEQKVRPEDVKPWGRGRLHLPTIHRIRLNKPGSGIRGKRTETGFSVTIAGRRVRESGSAIAKRDRRIASVKTDNSSAGAKVTFRFRGKVPGYRVRLRGDYVEFLISTPQ